MSVNLKLDDSRHIAVIEFQRPEKMNTMTPQMAQKLCDALMAAESNENMRVVVITGQGKAFCTGSDLSERLSMKAKGSIIDGDFYLVLLRKAVSMIEKMKKPVIAAINGHAVGAGLEIALACDMRIASATAKLGLPEVKVGTIAGAGGTQRLSRLIGLGAALEIILTGELVEGTQAQSIGLVNKVVSSEQVVPAALAMAQTIACRAPLSVQASKLAVRKGFAMEMENALDLEAQYSRMLATTADREEGMKAFIEKRQPRFTGK